MRVDFAPWASHNGMLCHESRADFGSDLALQQYEEGGMSEASESRSKVGHLTGARRTATKDAAMSGAAGMEPAAFHGFLVSKLGGVARFQGVSDRWICPVSIFDAPSGFGEEVWMDAQPFTRLVQRLAGAPVTCCWGAHAGRRNRGSAITLQPRGLPNHFSATGHIRSALLFLPDTLIDRVGNDLSPSRPAGAALREDLIFVRDPELERLFSAYLRAVTMPTSSLELEARAVLIVAWLLRMHHGFGTPAQRPVGGLSDWQLRCACDAMEAQLDGDVTLEAIARLAGVSATHFSRAFKQSIGMPTFAWLLQRRIERPKLILTDGRTPLVEVALAVGFAAQPQFTTAFRRVTGVTPGAWRRDRWP